MSEAQPRRVTKEEAEQLKQEHGPVFCFETDVGDVVFRIPSRPVYDRFTDQVSSENAAAPLRELCFACVVLPSLDEFKSMVDARPGIVGTLGRLIRKEAGANEKAEAKKL